MGGGFDQLFTIEGIAVDLYYLYENDLNQDPSVVMSDSGAFSARIPNSNDVRDTPVICPFTGDDHVAYGRFQAPVEIGHILDVVADANSGDLGKEGTIYYDPANRGTTDDDKAGGLLMILNYLV